MRSFLLLGLLTLLLVARTQAGDEIARSWLIAPPVVNELSPADKEAREELLKLIETRQDQKFRKSYLVEAPTTASGIPENYDLLLYQADRSGPGDVGARFKVEVRAKRAALELIDRAGIFRVEIPAAEIDRLARQLAYAFQAKVARRDETDLQETTSGSLFATHTSTVTIELISRDEKHPLHIKTPAWQPLATNVATYTHDLAGFAHSRLNDRLWELGVSTAEILPLADENEEILRRLKATPDTPIKGSLTQLEANIYGELAARRALAAAGSDLQRLKLESPLADLVFTTSENPAGQLKLILRTNRGFWHIDYASDPRYPERLPWLIAALDKAMDPSNAHYTVRKLTRSSHQFTPAESAAVAKYYRELIDPFHKIPTANLLLVQTHEDQYFNYLRQFIRDTPPTIDKLVNSRHEASVFLLKYAAKTGKRRAECAELLRQLLDELPADRDKSSYPFYDLGQFIGPLLGRDALPLLRELAAGESTSAAQHAIEGIATFDPPLAIELVHNRIEKYLAGSHNTHLYSNTVFVYDDLILWQRDVAAIPLLKRAWATLDPNELTTRNAYYDPQPIIDILEAKTNAQRTELLLAHYRQRYADERIMRGIVDQLIAEGADRKKCHVLLVDIETRRLRGR